ncbi:hypothetical protein [Kineosporia babensis]|uniref:Uncharacterized protein n=1 Tax=Kineosporia babensis TaxID=499548 RepID=A0A9X1SX95_9ACTN|nr:hypothetical protein [Kineosporia babensis]MCD5310048.1 hypothetical protein [Kineosporia babensis]
MSTLIEAPGPVQYVAAVRQELGDLGPDEVEELTGGLEADLVDALADSRATLVEMFGRPEVYAAELRAAAGLPPRAEPRKRSFRPTNRIRSQAERFERWLDNQSFGPDVRAFAVTVRPVWWVFRALVISQLILAQLTDGVGWMPYGFTQWLLFVILAVISIEAGRRNLAERDALRRRLIRAADVIAGIALILAFFTLLVGSQPGPPAAAEFVGGDADSEVMAQSDGIYNGSQPVRNIFPYDSEGNPLEGVQLFDEQGRPLQPVEREFSDNAENGWNYVELVPAQTAQGQERFNVYPLQERISGYDENGEELPSTIRAPRAPDRMQFPVTVPTPAEATAITPSAEPSQMPSQEPTQGPSQGPSQEPTAEATPGSETPEPTDQGE